jgi:hypothetical protein
VLHARGAVTPRPDGEEFDAYEWVSARGALERAASFRRAVYAEVLGAAGLT